jgi:hypothetical protein
MKDLDRNLAPEVEVLGQIHRRKAAGTDGRQQSEASNLREREHPRCLVVGPRNVCRSGIIPSRSPALIAEAALSEERSAGGAESV